MTKRILYVRSPEADFRPEMHISNYLLTRFGKDPCVQQLVEIDAPRFANTGDQSQFYDATAMSEVYARSALNVCNKVEDGDYIFYADALSPFIPTVHSHLHFNKINVAGVGGIFHSSTHTPGDYLQDVPWAQALEKVIIRHMLDDVFVATDYMKRILSSHYPDCVDKVHVTGLPLVRPYDGGYSRKSKTQVTFAHRWAPDKNPEQFIEICKATKLLAPTLAKFVVLHPTPIPEDALYKKAVLAGVKFVQCETRRKYWEEVAKSAVSISTATLETFGYAITDGIVMGSIPFVPDVACYPDLYSSKYRYDPNASPEAVAQQLLHLLSTETSTSIGGRLDVFNVDALDRIENCHSLMLDQILGRNGVQHG